MKKLVYLLFASTLLFAEDRDDSFEIIPYGQIFFLKPGSGVSYRYQKRNIGVQGDVSGAFGLEKSFIGVSASSIYYPFAKQAGKWVKGGWNLTLGLGAFTGIKPGLLFKEKKNPVDAIVPYLPISVGYQGRHLFFDIGGALVPVSIDGKDLGYDAVAPVPTAKIGFHF
ncbi:MAG: hypothetical protein FJZ59_01575 [Chlamydiae bacterium]|nr:hypothetical protein [Chlamydiota bacterium]